MLGDTLMEKGLITQDQLNKALEAQKADPSLKLGAILVKLGFISDDDIKKAL